MAEQEKKFSQLNGQLRGAENTINDMRAARDAREGKRPREGGRSVVPSSPSGGKAMRLARCSCTGNARRMEP